MLFTWCKELWNTRLSLYFHELKKKKSTNQALVLKRTHKNMPTYCFVTTNSKAEKEIMPVSLWNVISHHTCQNLNTEPWTPLKFMKFISVWEICTSEAPISCAAQTETSESWTNGKWLRREPCETQRGQGLSEVPCLGAKETEWLRLWKVLVFKVKNYSEIELWQLWWALWVQSAFVNQTCIQLSFSRTHEFI